MADIISDTDLAAYPGVTMPTDTDTTTLVVALANGLVSDIIGDLSPVPTKVRAITLEVAARALRNPEGYTSVTRKIDDWAKTTRHENTDATAAGVYLTPDEETRLWDIVRGSAQAGTIRLRVPGYDPRTL